MKAKKRLVAAILGMVIVTVGCYIVVAGEPRTIQINPHCPFAMLLAVKYWQDSK